MRRLLTNIATSVMSLITVDMRYNTNLIEMWAGL